MKTKKINKKLSLNKNTVAHLNSDELAELHGGDDRCSGTPSSCIPPCHTYVACTVTYCATVCGSMPCCE